MTFFYSLLLPLDLRRFVPQIPSFCQFYHFPKKVGKRLGSSKCFNYSRDILNTVPQHKLAVQFLRTFRR